VADSSLTAARVLRVLLAGAVALLVPGVVLHDSLVVHRLQVAGLWTLALAPFLVLAIVSAEHRRTRWFAAATIALVVIGFVLAR
jgi:hypothetical protein